MLGGFRNIEGVDLTARGLNPAVVPVNQLGVPTYDELVLVANEDRLDDDPEAIQLFIGALERGTDAAQRDPKAATDAILEAGDGLDPKLTAAEVERTLPLLDDPGSKHPYGYMDPGEWEEFAGFFADAGLIESRPTAGELLSNEHLPGRVPG
jgi:putative hydroxymethylpyrimidine transport system substrate-binding protein